MLLQLPTELRLEIYKHLIPDNLQGVIGVQNPNYYYKPFLRHDQMPCSPAMLRINRQIYKELIEIWYGTANFGLCIMDGEMDFLGVRISQQNNVLSPNLRLIRSLSLSIKLTLPDEWHEPCTKPIANCLSTGPYNLSTISLYGVVFDPCVSQGLFDLYLIDGGKRFFGILEWNLAPLTTIQGVTLLWKDLNPIWEVRDEWDLIPSFESLDDLRLARTTLEKLRDEHLEALASTMGQVRART